MKTCVAFTVLIIASTFDTAMGLAKYLDELPNGSSFTQELGHPDKDSSKFTDFATAFADAGHSWTAEFCGADFPGASMTNGAAFGDPCCTWKKGGTPDFTVTAFTTTPGKATVCASGSTSQTSTAASTASSTAGSSTTSTTTDPPATTNAPVTTDAPATTDAPVTTEAPTTPSAPSTPSGGCGVKGSGGKGRGKGNYSFRH